jgi:RNA polymerase sigma factor (sigma-70 family)
MDYFKRLKDVQPMLKGFILSKIYNNHDGEDILQDTNRILCIKKNDYDPNKSFKGWAFSIAGFQIKAYLTRIKRRKLILCPDGIESYCSPNSEFFTEGFNFLAESSPVEILQDKEDKAKCDKNINLSKNLLSNNERRVIELSSLDYKNNEIAKILRIKEGSVSAYKYRAIGKIKKSLSVKSK